MPSEKDLHPDVTATNAAEDKGESMTIGSYRLVQQVGEGGMGEVWLAEQKHPVRRRVAVKLVKAGMNTREVIARFESERQALALMDHPAIAKVLDAGVTPLGAPYFVMEYVAGVPITIYCDNHRLSTPERLELFMHVCEGVQHAHQKAIIHRDLKPSNILVMEVDGKPAPKIIDFGVAKAMTQKLTADTMYTRLGVIVGTPEYMSPEQATSSGEDIDTRTDIYSLGIILYELLAGERPIEMKKLAFDEFLRRLREEEAPKLSNKIRSQDAVTSASMAGKRRTEPLALARQMRGDLDSITRKALEKDRSRRYSSPSDFAADIARYLKNEPVVAVPPSLAYRARKGMRRHRVALITVCAFATVLIAATVVSIRQNLRATREGAVAEAVNDFLLNDVLAQASAAHQSDPTAEPDPDLKVRTALDRAAARIAGNFKSQPEVEAAIRDTIGRTYDDLGEYAEARKQLQRALELKQRAFESGNPEIVKTMNYLGRNAEDQGRYGEAGALYNGALELGRRVAGPEDPATLSSLAGLGTVDSEQGKYAKAEELLRQALEARRRVLGPESRDTLNSMNNLARVYSAERKDEAAEALDLEDLEIRRRVLGPSHPNTLDSMHNLAIDYREEGKYAQAEALDSQVLEVRRRERGPEHPGTLKSMGSLAADYVNEGKYAQAEALDRDVLDIRRRVLGPEHPDTLMGIHGLARVYLSEGKYSQAEMLFSQTFEIRRRVLGAGHPATLLSQRNLAIAFEREGKFDQAEKTFRRSLESNPNDPSSLNALAWYLVAVPDSRRRRPEEALQLSRRAVKAAPDFATYSNTLGLAAYRDGRWDEAVTALNRSVAIDKGVNPTNFLFLAMAFWKEANPREADRFFQQGVKAMSNAETKDPERRMFWTESANLLGKSAPRPMLR